MKAILASILVLAAGSQAQPEVILDGLPLVRISEYGVDRAVETLSPDDAEEDACLVRRIGNSYYWVTRANTELSRYENGAFVTFVAMDGSGYVRILNPSMQPAFDGLNRSQGDFNYVEHVLLGLTTVTYYGILRDPF